MKETLEILSDPETAIRILESIKQSHEGKTISGKKFIEKFGL
jgi:PHD/YefM family antitoxin component YafN of YafNO toxin-antitoxin module